MTPGTPDTAFSTRLEQAAQRCITAVTDPGVSAALDADRKRRLFVVLADMDFSADAQNYEIGTGFWYDAKAIGEKIHEEFPDAAVHFYPEYPTNFDTNRMMVSAVDAEEVVFLTFCTSSAYYASDGLTRRVENVLNAMIDSGKIAAVVHFGNPLAMQNIHRAPRMLFGYMMRQSQQYAVEVLSGKREASGKLPFQLNKG